MLTSLRRRRDAPPARPSTGGPLVYAVGDVHGCADLLSGLLLKVFEDALETSRKSRPEIVFLGDLIDRGRDSRAVLDTVLQLSRHPGVTVTILRGNHEQALLDFLSDPSSQIAWLQHGGRETLAAYDVDAAAGFDSTALRDRFAAALPQEHLRLLQQSRLHHSIGDYAFVHAGVRAGLPLERQSPDDLLWMREPFLSARPKGFRQVVVHGHTPAEARLASHRIGVDTGAYFTGVLTCVRLRGVEQRFIQHRVAAAA